MNPLIKQVLERFLKSQGRRILMRGAARLAAGLGAGNSLLNNIRLIINKLLVVCLKKSKRSAAISVKRRFALYFPKHFYDHSP